MISLKNTLLAIVNKISDLSTRIDNCVGVACSARGSASTLACTTGKNKLTLNTWISKTDDNFTFSDGGIKVPYTGTIAVSGSIYYLGGSSSTRVGCYITKNGSTTEITSQYGALGGAAAVSVGSAIIDVTAGDVLYLYGRASSSTNAEPLNGATHLDIQYIKR